MFLHLVCVVRLPLWDARKPANEPSVSATFLNWPQVVGEGGEVAIAVFCHWFASLQGILLAELEKRFSSSFVGEDFVCLETVEDFSGSHFSGRQLFCWVMAIMVISELRINTYRQSTSSRLKWPLMIISNLSLSLFFKLPIGHLSFPQFWKKAAQETILAFWC